LSADLKARIHKVFEEDRKREETKYETSMPHMKTLLLEIGSAKSFDVLIWMEGTEQTESNKDEQDLSILERANLVKGQTKYTHRNVYRRYELTQVGAELVEKLLSEK